MFVWVGDAGDVIVWVMPAETSGVAQSCNFSRGCWTKLKQTPHYNYNDCEDLSKIYKYDINVTM